MTQISLLIGAIGVIDVITYSDRTTNAKKIIKHHKSLITHLCQSSKNANFYSSLNFQFVEYRVKKIIVGRLFRQFVDLKLKPFCSIELSNFR